MANRAAETVAYGDCWGAKFCQKEVKEAHDKMVEELRKHIDWSNLTVDDCKELRFNLWSDKLPIWLIPIWLLDVIPAGTELTSISGEKVVFNTKEQGKWGREERGTGIPFERGQPFEVLLIATEEGFKVGL